MSNPDWPRALLGLACALYLMPAQACGPELPWRLLEDRAQTLAELPESNFAVEVRRLGQVIPGLKPASHRPGSQWDDHFMERGERRDEVEQSQLSEPQLRQVRRLRALVDARQAYAEGVELPAELRLYTAGAVAFAQADHELASAYFQQVLALPAAERPLRSTWAAYSLGRTQAARSLPGDLPAGAVSEAAEAARASFRQVRQLAIEGFSDPLELGIASLGEEARVDKNQGDWARAIELYASQYRQGSHSGYISLQVLAHALSTLPEPALIEQLRGLEVQQLLTAELLSRDSWMRGHQGGDETPEYRRLAELLLRSDIPDLANADRLAALSYRTGDYDSAAAFLAHADDSGLAWWLRAKLALRAGDKQLASQAYAQAAKAFPADEDWGLQHAANGDIEQIKPRCRVQGESALLALERGDYLEAFEQLYRSGELYWQDSAAVAERVLTLDELKAYVDAHAGAPSPVTPDFNDRFTPRPVAARLRQLLARRLLREGRHDEALAYFEDPVLRQAARDYGAARQAGADRWYAIDRAEALYAAAVMARRQGMELLGYEMAPDHAYSEGNHLLDRIEQQVPGQWLSAAEAARQNAHLAQPNRRFHYRYVAADLASQAADLLPPRSQAFGATLCKANDWLVRRDPNSAVVYYRRYLNEGAEQAWGFGPDGCQQPDFDLARERLWQYRTSAFSQWLVAEGWQLGLALALSGAGLWYGRRRSAGRHRQPHRS